MNYRKLPIINKICMKFDELNTKVDSLQTEVDSLRADNFAMNARLIQMKNLEKARCGKKINVVFVCHRPQVWNSLKTVFEQCNSDSDFNVTIVAIPLKKQLPDLGFNHEIYETEGAEEFWKDFPCKVVNGYNYNTKQWFDLKTLNPDYVFFQQPYNIAKCEAYKSWNVGKYTTIAFVHYGLNTNREMKFECLPADFYKNVRLHFVERQIDYDIYNEWQQITNNTFTKKYITGYPRFDLIKNYQNCESNMWKTHNRSKFRIIWTPRWCTNENNCHFFRYKDKWFDYCKNNDNVDFVFRPHPQAWLSYAQYDNFSVEDSKNYMKAYDNENNMNVDSESDYMPLFYSSDVLVTDFSSIIIEYFLTGKPIIYCKNDKSLFEQTEKWTEGFYYARTWADVEEYLNMLKSGEDPLFEKRRKLIRSEFQLPEKGAGYEIKELLKKDFKGELE